MQLCLTEALIFIWRVTGGSQAEPERVHELAQFKSAIRYMVAFVQLTNNCSSDARKACTSVPVVDLFDWTVHQPHQSQQARVVPTRAAHLGKANGVAVALLLTKRSKQPRQPSEIQATEFILQRRLVSEVSRRVYLPCNREGEAAICLSRVQGCKRVGRSGLAPLIFAVFRCRKCIVKSLVLELPTKRIPTEVVTNGIRGGREGRLHCVAVCTWMQLFLHPKYDHACPSTRCIAVDI